MKILVAGASGLIAKALVTQLRADGHDVRRLVRRTAKATDECEWDPAHRLLAAPALDEVEAIINLAGENIAGARWTKARREKLVRSRLDPTRTLVDAMSRASRRPSVFVNASAVGFYGDRGAEPLSETSAAGAGFLADLCQAWETEACRAEALGVRVTRVRFGVVLSRQGGALPKMRPIFRCGLGGRLGPGTQWMSWVSLPDVIGAIRQVLVRPELIGAVNVVAPGAVTNAEFTRELGHALRRPTIVRVPAFVLRLMFGRMADETLLVSARVEPRRLLESGYRFLDPTLATALAEV